MTYPIQNWKDGSKYSLDTLISAPDAFIQERKKCGQSDAEIRLAIWRWQFLRRHKLYQDHWNNGGDEYYEAFGIFGVPRPDPKIDFPIGLTFRHELLGNRLRFPAQIEIHKSWEENERNLKQVYSLLKTTTSPFDLAIASLDVPKGQATERKRQLGEERYPALLRVLDALATGETITGIAREIGNFPEGSLYNTASRLKKSALNIQVKLTGLPRMDEPDI